MAWHANGKQRAAGSSQRVRASRMEVGCCCTRLLRCTMRTVSYVLDGSLLVQSRSVPPYGGGPGCSVRNRRNLCRLVPGVASVRCFAVLGLGSAWRASLDVGGGGVFGHVVI